MGTLLNRRRYMGGGGTLPYDAEVEFLESKKVASQVIDTGFIPNQNTIIEAVVKLSDFGLNKHFVYGAGDNRYADSIELYTWNNITLNFNGNRTLSLRTLTLIDVPTSSFIKIVQQNGKNYIYDLQGNLIKEVVFIETTFTCSNTLVLFGLHRDNYIGLDIIKRLKVFDGITPVFDFIPVRVGQTGYLYDNISGRLFGQGDGSAYNLGPDKT